MSDNSRQNSILFENLPSADLHVDAIYLGGNAGNIRDEPLYKLIPGLSNAGGFRQVVNVRG